MAKIPFFRLFRVSQQATVDCENQPRSALSRRQSEIEEKLDLTKNQAPSQVDVVCEIDDEAKNSEIQNVRETVRHIKALGSVRMKLGVRKRQACGLLTAG